MRYIVRVALVRCVLSSLVMMTTGLEGMACTDCVLFLANGDLPGHLDDEGMVAEWVAKVADSGFGQGHIGEDLGFSWHGCDVCGSTLGGDSHRVFTLVSGSDAG